MMESKPPLTTKSYPGVPPLLAPLFAPLLVLGVTWLAFLLRLHQLGRPSLWYDELLELDIAREPLLEIAPQLIRHAAMPLDYYLLHGWVMLGRQESWVRFPALFCGVLAVPLTYALARCLFNRWLGVLAATLLAISPFAIRYSQEARPYALLMVCVLLTMLGLWQVYHTGYYRYWVLTIVGLVGAALSHYFTIFVLLPVGLFVLAQQLYHLKHKGYWLHSAFFLLAVLALLFLFINYGRVWQLYSVGERFLREIDQPELYTVAAAEKPNRGSGPPLNTEFFVSRVLAPISSAKPWPMLWYNGFFLLGVLALTAFGHKNRVAVLFLLGWLFLPILLIYAFLLHRGTFYAVRYILYTLPAYLILVAYGIQLMVNFLAGSAAKLNRRQQPAWFGRSLPLTLSLLALAPLARSQADALQLYYGSPAYEDWRSVGYLLQQNAATTDAVIAIKAEPAINWYYPPARAELGTYSQNQAIWQRLRQHPRRWFVLSSYSFKIDKGLRDWLAGQQAVRIAIDRRLVVYYHQADQSQAQMLEQVKHFALPQRAETYAALADQLHQVGDLESSKLFYQKAVDLAATPDQKGEYETRLAALPATP